MSPGSKMEKWIGPAVVVGRGYSKPRGNPASLGDEEALAVCMMKQRSRGRGRRSVRHAEDRLVPAGKDVELRVTAGGTSQDHPMGMEGRRGDGGALVALEEVRVRLNSGELVAVKVKHLDLMRRGTAV